MKIHSKTILGRAAEVITYFNNASQPAFTLKEAAALLKTSTYEAVKKLMRDMVKRGLLLRLKEGVYWIIPYEQDASLYFPNTHLVAKYIVGSANHYIGYYSALELHSLITQPSFREQIVVDKQIKPPLLKIKGHKFQFIYHNKNHFFGTTDMWVDSFNRTRCSDLEKTFIDCLFKPDYSGGIVEITKALSKSKEKIDYDKLIKYCTQFKSQSVVKRLGFLLELLSVNKEVLKVLKDMRTKSFVPLEPAYEKKGKLNSTWYILQNVEDSDIFSPIHS